MLKEIPPIDDIEGDAGSRGQYEENVDDNVEDDMMIMMIMMIDDDNDANDDPDGDMMDNDDGITNGSNICKLMN